MVCTWTIQKKRLIARVTKAFLHEDTLQNTIQQNSRPEGYQTNLFNTPFALL